MAQTAPCRVVVSSIQSDSWTALTKAKEKDRAATVQIAPARSVGSTILPVIQSLLTRAKGKAQMALARAMARDHAETAQIAPTRSVGSSILSVIQSRLTRAKGKVRAVTGCGAAALAVGSIIRRVDERSQKWAL